MQVGGSILRQGKVRPCSIALSRKSEAAAFTRIDAGCPIPSLPAKYVHACYVRPARFYIQTSWSGAASFSRIYTGKRPQHQSHNPDKVARSADQLSKSLSVSAPLRSYSGRARLQALREDQSIKITTDAYSITLERNTSEEGEPEATPIYAAAARDEAMLEASKRFAESDETMHKISEEFDFASPEFLEVNRPETNHAGLSRSKSRRKQLLEMHILKMHNKPSKPSDGEDRSRPFLQDEMEKTWERLGPVIAELSKLGESSPTSGEPAVRNITATKDNTDDLSPVNSDPELDAIPLSTSEHTRKINATGSLHPGYGLDPHSNKRNVRTGLNTRIDIPHRASPTGDRQRSSPISPDGSKKLHRKRRNSSIKAASQLEEAGSESNATGHESRSISDSALHELARDLGRSDTMAKEGQDIRIDARQIYRSSRVAKEAIERAGRRAEPLDPVGSSDKVDWYGRWDRSPVSPSEAVADSEKPVSFRFQSACHNAVITFGVWLGLQLLAQYVLYH
jgi:hypothetical protein